ncbi:MAG TPA: endolytic transglycosylase MltG, partial [Hanamia sp.]|nr:endolytic transglycosylase MltG [Hanamia sp.]
MKIRKIILYIILIIGLIFAYCAWNIFGPSVHNPKKKFLYIKTGSIYRDVKDSLLKNNLITNNFWFDQVAKYADYPQKVKAGKYKVTDGMSLYHLIKMLGRGNQVPVNLVITKLRTKEDL